MTEKPWFYPIIDYLVARKKEEHPDFVLEEYEEWGQRSRKLFQKHHNNPKHKTRHQCFVCNKWIMSLSFHQHLLDHVRNSLRKTKDLSPQIMELKLMYTGATIAALWYRYWPRTNIAHYKKQGDTWPMREGIKYKTHPFALEGTTLTINIPVYVFKMDTIPAFSWVCELCGEDFNDENKRHEHLFQHCVELDVVGLLSNQYGRTTRFPQIDI